MAGIYNDDESTDEEFGVNLHLVERLRINRGESSNFFEDRNFESPKDLKQYCNMRRKKFAQGGQSSSSSSLEMHNDSSTSGLVSSDIYPNKKRQNMDKNTEQLGNPKRTCLSDRLRRTPDWRELRRKNTLEIQNQPPLLPDSYYLKPGTSSNLLSDKKKEVNIVKLADESDSDFEIPLKKINRSSKIENGQCSKSTKCQSTAPNKKNQAINHENIASTSYLNKFFDSSDDESKSILQNGALKGGRQESSNDPNLFTKRLVNRKINKKLLESDDSEDDTSVSVYRSRPLVFSSSDSDDSRQNALKSKHTDTMAAFNSSHSWSDSFDKNAGHRSRQHKSFRSNPKYSKKAFNSVPSNKTENTEGCERQFLSSDYQRKNGAHRSCRTRRSPRINITANLTSNGFSNGNNISGPVRGRRANGSDRGGRRSGSPHPRMARSQPKNEDSKCGRGRSVSASRTQKDKSNYSARYPDLFDAEESDNEFFTANSYSDTETSTESLGGLTINTTFPNHNGSISCTINCEDRLFEDASSDDEISVVFSTSPFGRNDSRRGASRTLGRRHSRGTPHRQIPSVREVVSLSPDPVEQVRQMEEDERMARMLQAQYDAEVDPDYTPVNNYLMEPEETDDEILDPLGDSDSDDLNNTLSFSPFLPVRRGFAVNRFSNRTSSPAAIFLAQYDADVDPDYSPVSNYLMEPEDSADVILDPLGHSDLDDPNNTLTFPPFFLIRRGFGVNRVSNRTSSPAAVFLGRRMDARNRRRHQTSREPAENHLNRLLHLGMHDMSQFFGGDYYEALLSLDLDGEVVPRGLPRSDINRLPTRKYIHPNSTASSSTSSSEVTHKRTDLNKECQVCLSDYVNGDILRILPCFHEFHTPCIDPWLTINQTCPVCRVSVDLDA